MLVKLIGAGLVVGATTYAGWQVAAGYSSRPRQLRDLQTALAVLQTEIDCGATPLPEALAAAAAAAGSTIGPIFTESGRRLRSGGGTTPTEAVCGALAERTGATALQPDDVAIVEALAAVLGASGRHDQVRHLTLARERLAREEARAVEDRLRYEKVARYLGVLTGVTMALIFL